jgi:hypothetical protein
MADAALQCVDLLARDHWASNMVSTHDSGAIFNLDASGGLPALVVEMLVQSQPGSVILLPALPDRWSEGRVTGLTLRGGIRVVSLEWRDGRAEAVLEAPVSTSAARHGDLVTVNGKTTDLSAGPMRFRFDL